MRTPYIQFAYEVHIITEENNVRVLVSGAGIAGPALAYWLRHHGATPTVVERDRAWRPGGQAVDVRGAALTVVERMGLLEDLRAVRTRMRGMSVLDHDGTELMRSEEFAASSGRLDSADVEVLREDLVALLARRTAGVEYVFGDSIAGIRQDADGVDVTFERGGPRRFDLVVGADGLHSNLRRLAFGPEPRFLHHLGMYVAVFTTANLVGLDNWQVWLRDETAGAGIYPARDNTELRVNVGFFAGSLDYDRRDLDAQRRLIAEHTTGLGWEMPRLLEAMWQAPDFYFDAMAQIRMDTWSNGRVTLLGDAGYCPTPMSGQGTSLALVGAYVLAEEIARDPAGALARYEARVRPFAELNQALATENPGFPAAPESIERAKHAISL
jgi:2-polyprenyl-6-methoxyphenol hydroxylase-like FAD-dependent oxidoreductase